MSQETIMQILKKNPNKWFTIQEISKKTNVNKSTAANSLTKLFKHNEIFRKNTRNKKGYSIYLYKYK